MSWLHLQRSSSHHCQAFSASLLSDACMVCSLHPICCSSAQRVDSCCRKHPPLLTLSPVRAAERMLSLKLLVPEADVFSIVSKRPSILQMEVSSCDHSCI